MLWVCYDCVVECFVNSSFEALKNRHPDEYYWTSCLKVKGDTLTSPAPQVSFGHHLPQSRSSDTGVINTCQTQTKMYMYMY